MKKTYRSCEGFGVLLKNLEGMPAVIVAVKLLSTRKIKTNGHSGKFYGMV